jgi:1,4-alpha-glucan branching enzyme
MASGPELTFNPDTIMSIDPWLEPNLPALSERRGHFDHVKHNILSSEGSYDAFTKGYKRFGLNVQNDNSVTYTEWAPNAVEASLIGDFSM